MSHRLLPPRAQITRKPESEREPGLELRPCDTEQRLPTLTTVPHACPLFSKGLNSQHAAVATPFQSSHIHISPCSSTSQGAATWTHDPFSSCPKSQGSSSAGRHNRNEAEMSAVLPRRLARLGMPHLSALASGKGEPSSEPCVWESQKPWKTLPLTGGFLVVMTRPCWTPPGGSDQLMLSFLPMCLFFFLEIYLFERKTKRVSIHSFTPPVPKNT